MNKKFSKIISMILAIIIGISTFATAFAAEIAAEDIAEAPSVSEDAPDVEEKPELIEAEITGVPFKNLIVFGLSPKTPEGITVELKYSDGTVVTDKIVFVEIGEFGDYYVNGELVEVATVLTAVRKFGIQDAVFYMNDGTIELSHKYLLLPSILTIINGIF